MIDHGKKNVLGVMIDAVDYEAAVERVTRAAETGRPYAVSALAVHGVMTGVESAEHQYRLNSFDLVVPDGQPVRWALNLLYKLNLADRVYGPDLTLKLFQKAEETGLPVYLYGTTPVILAKLLASLRTRYPKLIVAGAEPSAFRKLNEDERVELAARIAGSGAKMVFVGLGCPRQEVFAYEMKALLSLPFIAVGAAFAFIAGELPQAPPRMQRYGLEWLFRFKSEPRRLWHRYMVLNPYYVFLLSRQLLGRKYPTTAVRPVRDILYG